jgi:DNA transformation protein
MSELSHLPNVGKVLENNLLQVGIQGAIEGVPDKLLSDRTKQILKQFYEKL